MQESVYDDESAESLTGSQCKPFVAPGASDLRVVDSALVHDGGVGKRISFRAEPSEGVPSRCSFSFRPLATVTGLVRPPAVVGGRLLMVGSRRVGKGGRDMAGGEMRSDEVHVLLETTQKSMQPRN